MTRVSAPKPAKETIDKDKVTIDRARQWCSDARKIVGKGLIKESKKIKSCNTEIASSLDKLHDKFGSALPLAVQQQEERYKDLAIELKLLAQQHEQLELALENAKKQQGTNVPLFRDKKKRAQWERAVQEAESARDQKREDIKAKAKELEQLASTLTETLKAKETEDKDKEKRVKGTPDEKVVSEAQSLLSDGQKLADYFAKSGDPETAQAIGKVYDDFAAKDFFAEPNKAQLRDEIQKANATWSTKKERYESGRRTYEKNFSAAQAAVAKVNELLKPADVKAIIGPFTTGQNAALRRQWDVAGEHVNENLVKLAEGLYKTYEKAFNEWQQWKQDHYLPLKAKLDALDDANYSVLGLEPLAALVGEAERSKDYAAAKKKIAAVEAQAEEVLKVAAQAPVYQQQLAKQQAEIAQAIDALKSEARLLAERHRPALAAASDQFWSERHVATPAELTSAFQAAKHQLDEAAAAVKKCQDPAAVKQQVAELTKQCDVAAYREILQGLAGDAERKIFAYEGLGADPAGDPQRIAGWQTKLDAAAKFCESLARVEQKGKTDNAAKITEQYLAHTKALQTLSADVQQAHTTAAQAIPAAQNELKAKVKALRSLLTDNRWMTLRQAAWHADAKEEVGVLEALADTGNLVLLKESTARVVELTGIASKALDYYIGRDVGEIDPRYDQLKDRFEKVVDSLNKKDVKRLLATKRQKVVDAAVGAREELRKAGPGVMDRDFAKWDKRAKELERESQELRDAVERLQAKRKELEQQIGQLKARVGGELAALVKQHTGKDVSPDNLPIMQAIVELEPRLAAESLDAFVPVEKRLKNLAEELEFLIEDGKAGTGMQELATADAEAKAEQTEETKILLKLQAEYDYEHQQYRKAWEVLKALEGVDKAERKRIRGVYDGARKAFEKKNFPAAAREMRLAARMAEQLVKDPLASQTTERGTKHLKELHPRWSGGIGTLIDSVATLEGRIGESCAEETDFKPADVTTPFDQATVQRLRKLLDPDAFLQELLAMQAARPKDANKGQDVAKKRKHREQALAKVRRYRDLLMKDPSLVALLFEPNPWSRSGGQVIALPVMRALNDLDLNLQRGV